MLITPITRLSDATNLKPGATIGGLSHRHRPAVGPHDLLHDREPKACPLGDGRVAMVENLVALIRGDSRSVTSHVESRAIVKSIDIEGHIGTTMLNGVPEQILEELLEAAFVGLDLTVDGDSRRAGLNLLPCL